MEEILSDEKIREINYYHEKWERDEAEAKAYAFDKGEKEGLKLGIEKGMKNKAMKVAKEMLKDKVDMEIIMKYTGVSKEEIEELMKDI